MAFADLIELLVDATKLAHDLEKLLIAFADRHFDLIDLPRNFCKGTGAVLGCTHHVLEVGNAASDTRGIHVVPRHGLDCLKREELFAAGLGFLFEIAAPGLRLEQSLFSACTLRFEYGALRAVIEAEHPVGAVVDLPLGVLLVTCRGVLDLAGAQYRSRMLGELLEVFGTQVVHARGNFVREPLVELAFADLNLRPERARIEFLGGGFDVRVDAVIGHAPAQFHTVDLARESAVGPFGHEDRAGEAAQRLLGGGRPFFLSRTHLQQLGGERKVGWRDARTLSEEIAKRDVIGVEVRGARRERGEFLAGRFESVRVLADLGLCFPLGLRFVLFVVLECGPQLRDLALGLREGFFVRGGVQARERELSREFGRAFAAAVALNLEARDLLFPVIDLTATGTLALLFELSKVAAGVGNVLREAVAVRTEAVLVARQPVFFVGEEPHKVAGSEHIDVVSAVDEFTSARASLPPYLVGIFEARENVALFARGHERVVHLGEVLEVCECLIGEVERAGFVEHVIAKERVDVAELLR